MTPAEPSPAAPTPAPPPAPHPPRAIEFASGELTLHGELRASARRDAPLVIFVHQLGATHDEWDALAERVAGTGSISTLAFDMRGHGESNQRADGTEFSWGGFELSDWQACADDVLAAIAWARSPASGITPTRFAAVGSSIGSSAVIGAAAREPAVGAVVALSPGRAYRGYDAITPTTELVGRRFFAAASAEELDSAETARAMARITSSTATVVPGAAHGTALFSVDDSLMESVAAFLESALSTAPPRTTAAQRDDDTRVGEAASPEGE